MDGRRGAHMRRHWRPVMAALLACGVVALHVSMVGASTPPFDDASSGGGGGSAAADRLTGHVEASAAATSAHGTAPTPCGVPKPVCPTPVACKLPSVPYL